MAMSPSWHRVIGSASAGILLLAASAGLFVGRKRFIQAFFPRGPGGAPPPALITGPEAGVEPAERVRVALLDGVDRETSTTLPNYDGICRRGLDLLVDVGFPSVSLPVQSALWTGLTQQQTGIEFVQALIEPPPEGSIPVLVPSSAAVAESHPFIVHSFGFARAWPPLDIEPEALVAWKAGGFAARAIEEVRSDARLVFVHMLAADTAGHKFGRDSAEFAAAARADDQLLGQLIVADATAHADRSRWLVLADHGHRPAGGHGGEERPIRIVRACLVGADLSTASAPRGHLIHLVDVSRALSDSLGLAPHPQSAGRPLHAALAAPVQPRATLPRPGALRWTLAAIVLSVALIVTWLAAGQRSWNLPWWWVIAYLSVVAIESAPTLSTPMIYRPLGRDMYLAALPGLCFLAVIAAASARRASPWRVGIVQLLVPAGFTAASLILCARRPPLMPVFTAHASLCMVMLFSGALVVALACLSRLVPFGSGPDSPPETPDTAT